MRLTLPRGLAVLALTLALPATVLAAPPPNDVHPGLTIGSIPFTQAIDTTEAEIHALEPSPTCAVGVTNTVWYTFAATTDLNLVADSAGSDYDTVIDVFQGTLTDDFFDPGFDALAKVGCNDNAGSGLQSRLAFSVGAGENYLIRVSSLNGDGGSLAFSLDQALPNVAMAQRLPMPTIVGMLLVLGALIIGLRGGSRQRVASTAGGVRARVMA